MTELYYNLEQEQPGLLSGLLGGYRFRFRYPFPVPFESETSNRMESKTQTMMNLDRSRKVFYVQGFGYLNGCLNCFCGSNNLTAKVLGIWMGRHRPALTAKCNPVSILLSIKATAGKARVVDIGLDNLNGCSVNLSLEAK